MEENKMSKFLKTIDTKNMKFYKVPKDIFSSSKYDNISTEAKFLYTFLLDRMFLSEKNNWSDKNGEVYFYFTVEETMRLLKYGHGKVTRLFNELSQANLIYRKSCGPGKAKIIYMIKSSDLFN